MTKLIKMVLTLVALILMMPGCGGKTVRDLAHDPGLRVFLDPTIPSGQYVLIRRALIQSGKFELVERRDLNMVIGEQDLQFRSQTSDRFDPREKWAHIGKLLGAAMVITGQADCYEKKNFWGTFKRACRQNLTAIDGVTGQDLVAVENENTRDWTANWIFPDWDDTVSLLVKEYPKYFEPRANSPELEEYRNISEERSKREDARTHQYTEAELRAPAAAPAPSPVTPEVAPSSPMQTDAADTMPIKLGDNIKLQTTKMTPVTPTQALHK